MPIQKPELIYIYDAYCTWCYGFSNVVRQLSAHYGHRLDYSVLSGGMVRGARVAPIAAVAPLLAQGYQQVAATTGAVFGAPFLNLLAEGTALVDSEMTGAALTVFKRYRPAQALDFAHVLQSSFYQKGIDLSNYEAYRPIFQDFGLDTEGVLSEMASDELRYETMVEFQTIDNWGIKGFPCALLKLPDNQYFMIAKGFSPFETVKGIIEKIGI